MTDNACHSNGTLTGKCSVYATDGGCRICNDGFYRHEKACLACDTKCRTCGNAESCSTCADTHFMTLSGVCRNKSEIVGCAVEISSEYGCIECVAGFFVKERMCSLCNATFESCAVCDEDVCADCVKDHILKNGACIHFTNITHCTAADGSKCTECTFWHKPAADGLSCKTHAVWWVVLLLVVVCLLIAVVCVVLILFAINFTLRRVRMQEQRKTTCIFKMARSNVKFLETKQRNIVVNKREIVFDDGAIPVDAESKELLCVGNKGKKDMKVQFVAKEGNDKFTVRSNPSVVTLEKGMACEFEVFVTPLCTCTIYDKIVLIVQEHGVLENITVSVWIKAATEVSTKLHYDDIACETQIGEGSFGVVFKGTFRGEDVAVKKMKEVGASEESMDEFEKRSRCWTSSGASRSSTSTARARSQTT